MAASPRAPGRPGPTRPARWPKAAALLLAGLTLLAALLARPALASASPAHGELGQATAARFLDPDREGQPPARFTPPPLDGHVVDTAGKLSPQEILALDAHLEQIRRRTGFEIVAFVVGSLQGEAIEDVAYTAFNTWQIGRKGADNGVLLVIAPSERRVRIETGKGVGGALTDLQSNDIIRRTISPLLREDRFADAIEQGSDAIAETLVAGTPDARPPAPPTKVKLPSATAVGVTLGVLALTAILAVVSPAFRAFLFLLIEILLSGGGRGGGGGGGGGFGGGSGYQGVGGSSGGGGSSDSY